MIKISSFHNPSHGCPDPENHAASLSTSFHNEDFNHAEPHKIEQEHSLAQQLIRSFAEIVDLTGKFRIGTYNKGYFSHNDVDADIDN